jgi:hypothetical protein
MHGGCGCKPKPMGHGGCPTCGPMPGPPPEMGPPPGPPPEMPEVDPQQLQVVQEAAQKFIEGLKNMGVAALDMSVVFDGEEPAEEDDGDDQENVEILEE